MNASWPRAARSLAPQAEQHRGAHAFGGLRLHAEILERHAELEVRHRIVELEPASAFMNAGIASVWRLQR